MLRVLPVQLAAIRSQIEVSGVLPSTPTIKRNAYDDGTELYNGRGRLNAILPRPPRLRSAGHMSSQIRTSKSIYCRRRQWSNCLSTVNGPLNRSLLSSSTIRFSSVHLRSATWHLVNWQRTMSSPC